MAQILNFFLVLCFFFLSNCKSPSKSNFQSNTNTEKKSSKVIKAKPLPPEQKAAEDMPSPSDEEQFLSICGNKSQFEPFITLRKVTGKRTCTEIFTTLKTLANIDLSWSNCCTDKEALESLKYLQPDEIFLKGTSISDSLLSDLNLSNMALDLSYTNVSEATIASLSAKNIVVTKNSNIADYPEDAIKLALMKGFLSRPEGQVNEILNGSSYRIALDDESFPRAMEFSENLAPNFKSRTQKFTLNFKIRSFEATFTQMRQVTVKNAGFNQDGSINENMQVILEQNQATKLESDIKRYAKLSSLIGAVTEQENLAQDTKDLIKKYDDAKATLNEANAIIQDISENRSDDELANYYAAKILRQGREIFNFNQ